MKKVSKIAFTILGIIGALFLAVVIGLFVFIFWALSDSTEIRKVYPSPNGKCQAEIVDYLMGGDAYCSYVYIDYPNFKNEFRAPGQEVTKKAVRIDGVMENFGEDFYFEWLSDDKFLVVATDPYVVRYTTVSMSDDAKVYSSDTRMYDINTKESYFDDFTIEGDKVYEMCSIQVVNDMDIPAVFKLEANDYENAGKLLEESDIVAVDGSDNEAVFTVEPHTTENLKVTFLGKKGPEDTRQSRDLVKNMRLIPVID